MTDFDVITDESQFALPDGWVWTNIGSVAHTTSGGTPSRKKSDYFQGDIPWVKSGELNDGIIYEVEEFITREALNNSSAKIFPAGTSLVALYGATVGKTGILGIDAATNQAVCAIFPIENFFTAKYMTYWLFFQRRNLVAQSVGGAQPNINQHIIRSLAFPLPPTNEQICIVEAIETLFSRIDEGVSLLKRLQTSLRRYKAAVLKAACEGRLVEQNPEDEPASVLLERILQERREKWKADGRKGKYVEPQPPDTSDLPDLPEGWVWASLDEIAQVRNGVTKGRKFNGEETIFVPYLRVANVQDGYLDLSEIKTIEIRGDELERYRLAKNDILFNEGGDRDKLGRGAIWRDEIEDCVHQNHVYAVRLYADGILAEWVNMVRKLTYARDYFWSFASQTVNLASINATNLRGLPIPIPPTTEQFRILEEVDRFVSVIDELNHATEINLIRAERLKQSILKRAFEGRLVPQNPEDEPASVLLARIRRK